MQAGSVWAATSGKLIRVTPGGERRVYSIGDRDPRTIAAGPHNTLLFNDANDRFRTINAFRIPRA